MRAAAHPAARQDGEARAPDPAEPTAARARQRRAAEALAREALERYGLAGARISLLEQKTNVTFRVDGGPAAPVAESPGMVPGRYLLRLCQPGAYDRRQIASEVEWLEFLRADGGLVVPRAVPAPDGSHVTRLRSADGPEARHCVLFQWVRGELLEASPRPELVRRLGELAGRIHACSERFVPPAGFRRPRWTLDSLFGPSRIVPEGAGEPFVTARTRRILDQAAGAVREEVASLGEGGEVFGMIHKDLEPDNTVVDEGRVRAIDFADCGWGYYLYDLAAALLPLRERKGYPELRDAFLAGYRAVRPLRREHLELLETFLIARCIFSIRFMVLHSLDRPDVRRYAERVIPLMAGEIRRYLERRRRGPAGPREAADPGEWTTMELLVHLRRAGVSLWAEGESLRFRAARGALPPELRRELARRKAEVLAFLRQSSRPVAARPGEPAIPRGAEGPAPLSFAQQRLWFLDRLRPGSSSYNVSRAILLEGALEVPVLGRCLNEIVRRHEVLRSTFAETDGVVVQRARPTLRLAIPLLDLQGLPEPARGRELGTVARREAERPFDLGRGPLVRLLLVRLGAARHAVVSTMHHIVSDGWSTGVLFREIGALYRAFSRGRPSPLAELPIQYADFARWQRGHLAGEVLEEQLGYWRRELEGAPAESPLPLDRPRSAAAPRGGRLDFLLPPETAGRLAALGRERETTLFMLLLGAFDVLLHRVSGLDDVVVGSPIANRNRTELEGLIGFFVNTVVLRSRLQGEPTFRELMARVRTTTVQAYEHQDVPFELLVEELRPERRLDRNPLFQVLFILQNAPRRGFELPGLRASFLPLGASAAKFDLTVSLQETARGLEGALRYRRDLLDASTVARLAASYRVLVEAVARDPDLPVERAPLLPSSLRHQVLREWNDSRVPARDRRLVHEVVADQAGRTPEAIAVACGREHLSYRELARRSAAGARRLAALGVGPDELVGICLERSADLVVALLAVLEAGAAYLVLDPEGPRRRLDAVLADARPALVLAAATPVPDLAGYGGRVAALEPAGPARDGTAQAAGPLAPDPRGLAYAVYTSGSTGTPKGVLVQHEALANHMEWISRVYPIARTDSVLHRTPFSFDPSVGELWAPLMVGARLVMSPSATYRDPAWLARRLAEERSATLQVTPSLLRELLAEPALGAWRGARRVYCGGEDLSRGLLDRFGRTLPADLCNVYGPAEACIHATAWTWRDRRGRDAEPAVPVGRPIDNARVFLLDAAMRPTPVGSTGELFVGGAGVARGYLGRPARSAEVFVPDPWGPRPGGRLYRSGDLGRQRPDGTIELAGRRDGQIKVRGVRVEPGEVEAALLEHPALRAAAVRAWPAEGGSRRLVAYVVAHDAEAPPAEELRRHLASRLPAAMVPAAFVALAALPRTAGGKVDRRALPEPEPAESPPGGAPSAPATPTEEILAEIWKEVLEVPEVGALDDFFELGGHSLLAVRLTSRLRALFGVELPLRRVFEAPTVRRLATLVDGLRRGGGERPLPPLTPVARDRDLPASYAQERLWFLDRLDPGVPAYNLPAAVDLAGRLRPSRLARALREVVGRHEVLRTTFGDRQGRPVQRIRPPGPVPLPVADLTSLPRPLRRAELQRLARSEARRRFDLGRGPLARFTLVRTAARAHRVLATLHHAVFDGWSTGVFLRELAALYGAFVRGLPSPLPELDVQYADYAAWQRALLAGGVLEEDLEYWRKALEGAPDQLALPTDRPRPPVQTSRGAVQPLDLDPALGASVASFARESGATVFMVLLAAFQALLARLSRQEVVTTGCPVAGRSHPRLEGLIGLFVNTLVLRADLGGRVSFRELVARVRATTLDAYAHQEVPFERLVEELAPDRDPSRHPLFQAMFALQNAPRAPLDAPGLRLTPVSVPGGTAKFDLTLVLHQRQEGFRGGLEFSTDLFDASTIRRLGRHLEVLLRRSVAAPDHPVLEQAWLSAAGRQQLLVEWCSPPAAREEAGLVHQRVERRAREAPDSIALRGGGRSLSYRELDARAEAWARRLAALGIGPESLVAVCLERSVDEVAALYGILKAGGAYLPVDPELPGERIAFMLEDSGARAVIAPASLGSRLPALPSPLLDVAAPADRPGGRPAPRGDAVGRAVSEAHLAYVIYTSGSTGRPKGVQLHHGGLANLIRWHGRAFRLSAGDRGTRLSGLAFDASVWELWPYLAAGATVLVPDGETRKDPAALRRWLLREGATASFVATPMAEELLALEWPRAAPLRTLLTGGDKLHGHPPAGLPFELVNNYGPTEATVVATSGPVPGGGDRRGAPTLGRPIRDTGIYVLDPGRLPVPIGVAGEIHVGGAGLGRGYLGRAGLTAERFAPAPFGDRPGARLYATGDLGRLRPGGELEFLGRIDHQVQLRGFRIELEEIEAVLAGHPDVRESLVLLRDGAPGGRVLVAYVVPEPGAEPGPEALRDHLARSLPRYMLPGAFVLLPALPLTANGKVDREALPAPRRPEAGDGDDGPRTPAEELVAGIWAEVLSCERVGLDDDFFRAGGHSLLATQVVSRIRDRLGVELGLRELFEGPTVRELARRVDERRQTGVGAAPPPIRRAAGRGGTTLSFAQERLWFLCQFAGARAAYNVPLALELAGELRVPAFARALTEVVRRHEVLRTAFEASDGRPRGRVRPPAAVALPVVDLSRLPPGVAELEARRVAGREARRPFDLTRGRLLRAGLLRLEGRRHVALVTFHHIASDGWSVGVFTREVAALYPALLDGRPSPLRDLPVQYGDFARWQRRHLSGEVLERQTAYWRERLRDAPRRSGLPTDRPRPAVQSFRGAALGFILSEELAAGLRALARECGVTLFMLLLAAFDVLLHRLSGHDDLVVGTPVAGRSRRELEGLIGFFANTLVLRTRLVPGEPFDRLLDRVRGDALDAYAHQDLPFEQLVEAVQGGRDLSQNPLFQVAFALQNAPLPSATGEGLEWRSLGVEHGTAKFDLTLSIHERGEGLRGSIELNRDLFDETTVRRWAGTFRRDLERVVADPRTTLDAFDPLSPAERQQLLEWNDTETAPPCGSVPELVRRRAGERPDAVAVDGPEGVLTYRELDRRARRLARELGGRGIGRGARVGVCARRSVEEIVACLGVLTAGAAYLPLDPAQPVGRLRWMARDAGAAAVVGPRELAGPVAGDGISLLALDEPPGERPPGAGEPATPAVGLRDPAYLIYTSGSTGTPKGVEVEHGSLGRLVRWHRRSFGLAPGDRSPHLASQGFDASVWETWPPLAVGATLLLPREEPGRMALGALRDWLVAARATVCFLPTPLAEESLALDWPPETSLRSVLTGGDRLRSRPPRGLPFRLVNDYGPTENTVVATSGPVDIEGPGGRLPPIGRPIDGTRVLLLDRWFRPVPPGVAGELCLAGEGLARGYPGRAALTAAAFVPSPEGRRPGGRLYRTGDLARWLPRGEIEFLGRVDQQVKVRGYRVEPGEIESVLARHAAVRECVVSAPVRGAGERVLVCHCAPEPGADLEREALREYLARRLPEYMVPVEYRVVSSLPLTSNGKVDRQALAALAGSPTEGREELEPPGDALELELVGLWEELLGRRLVGVRDDFFSLGGHSLLAMRLLARIRHRRGCDLSPEALFRAPTVAGLAGEIRRYEAGTDRSSPLVAMRSGGEGRPLFCVHPVGGGVLCYAELARRLAGERPVYGIQLPRPESGVGSQPTTVEELAARYADLVREADPSGPALLLGWSMGGVVAFETARRLELLGHPVGLVALVDAYPPGSAGDGDPAPASASERMALFLRDLVSSHGGTLAEDPRDLLAPGTGEPWERVRERLREAGPGLGDLSAGELTRRFAAFDRCLQAYRGYRPRPFAGRLVLFAAQATLADGRADLAERWRPLAQGGLEVDVVPGDHYRLLRDECLGEWVGRLRSRFRDGAAGAEGPT